MKKGRTTAQNKALHVLFREVAIKCQEAGITAQQFIENIEVDVTEKLVKDVYRAMCAKHGIDSTAKLSAWELQDVYEELNRHIAQFGMHEPFPDRKYKYYEEITY